MMRVGILGTGRMAGDFAAGLATLDDAVLHAVGSRSAETAQAFADRFAHRSVVPRPYASYAGLLSDPDVDLVYVATPHSEHARLALMALDHGKPVLCEKPFAINARETQRVVDRARDRGLFVAEALWSRHLPAYARLRELLDAGTIGDVQLMVAGGAFMPDPDPDDYLFDPARGGGVLLDAGVYLVSLASMVFGTPDVIRAVGRIGEFGVDDQDAILLGHDGGAAAMLYVSLRAQQLPDVSLFGDKGRIYLHGPVFAPTRLTLDIYGEEAVDIDLPFAGNGYQYQVADAARCIAARRAESAVMPLDESLAIMQTMDEIRRQVGLRYPMEE